MQHRHPSPNQRSSCTARRRVQAAGAALAAAGALVLAGLPGSASAQSDASPTPSPRDAAATAAVAKTSPEVLQAMQRDLGLTAAQAKARLVNEADAGAAAGSLQAALGRDFAGAWVTGATSASLTVATTDARDVAAIEAEGARALLVRHSVAQLDAAKAKLDRAAKSTRTADAPVWYVDVKSNAVVVNALKTSAADKFVAAAGVDADLVKIKKTAERPRPFYDIVGGEAYYMGSGGRCSVGFSITQGATQGFATAGHCGRAGTTTRGVNQQAQGTFRGSIFPGKDMAWVAANSQWTATPYVKGSGGQRVGVAGSTQSAVGASICRSGSTTGWHCGTISQHNTSVTYPEGTISGVTRTTVCAEPGDSGGSYISGSQAQGVTSGGSGNCRSGGTTFHQPINPLLQQYSLTLKTTGGGQDPDPDPGNPGNTTWAEGKVYAAGDTVVYDGTNYRCLQPHQAQPGWEPPSTPALWEQA
ncbi:MULTISPECIES: alpha-lytic protease prodomain-containing protein [Streptomyces]|uniref:Serine protease n=2 Tax=Streptomyces TaxID=1883 RepID=A0A0W7WWN5_9ACTN|nr:MULTISPECIES: alpha-lytic protease prodomain-containing protein [Streptomyces]KUF15003.1 serine protease [Streptomyces silvensis]MVO89862.1 S1 family peptidase [Streptomyces typhae]